MFYLYFQDLENPWQLCYIASYTPGNLTLSGCDGRAKVCITHEGSYSQECVKKEKKKKPLPTREPLPVFKQKGWSVG